MDFLLGHCHRLFTQLKKAKNKRRTVHSLPKNTFRCLKNKESVEICCNQITHLCTIVYNRNYIKYDSFLHVLMLFTKNKAK